MDPLSLVTATKTFGPIVKGLAILIGKKVAKAGCRKIYNAWSGQTNEAIEKEFSKLRSNQSLCREVQILISNALKSLPSEEANRAAGNVDLLGNVLLGYLASSQNDAPAFLSQFRSMATELGLADDSDDCSAVDNLVVALLIQLGRSDLLPLMLVVGQSQIMAQGEQIIQCQDELAKDQAASFERADARIDDLIRGLKAFSDEIQSRTQAANSLASPALPNGLTQESQLQLELIYDGFEFTSKSAREVDTHLAVQPPHLPETFVQRSTVYEAISKRLNANPILAITGYQGCGKTVSVAGYARYASRNCFWFAFRSDTTDDSLSTHVLRIALRQFLESESLDERSIQISLRDKIAASPTLIVLDNVEHLNDFKILSFLLEVARDGGDNLQLILLYAESPDITESARLAMFPTWRLPGMATEDALKLFELLEVDVTPIRSLAIGLLCSHCDGHVGMLRTCKTMISQVSEEHDLNQFLVNVPNSEQIAQFLEALISKFISQHSSDEYRLCQYVSIVFDGFSRGLASALWSASDDAPGFDASWVKCKARVFESVRDDQFAIPLLYRNGIRDNLEKDKRDKLHITAGEFLLSPLAKSLHAEDAANGVQHLAAGGQFENAVREIIALMGHALHSERQDVLAFFHSRFRILSDIYLASDNATFVNQIGLCALHSQAARATDDAAGNARWIEQLHSLLSSDTGESSEVAVIGWWELLNHAVEEGNPDLSLEAMDRIPQSVLRNEKQERRLSFVPLVFSAFINADESVARFAAEILSRVERGTLIKGDVWQDDATDAHWYELWRAVGTQGYTHASRISRRDLDEAKTFTAELWKTVELARSLKLPEIAIALGACAVTLDVDIVRDINGAVERSSWIDSLPEGIDQRFVGLAQSARGDALRCSEEFKAAKVCFEQSLAAWPVDCHTDRSQVQVNLGVVFARLGNPADALRHYRQGASDLKDSEDGATPTAFARIWLEASVVALADAQRSVSLSCRV